MASLKHNVVPKIGAVVAFINKWIDGLGVEFFRELVGGAYMKEKKKKYIAEGERSAEEEMKMKS